MDTKDAKIIVKKSVNDAVAYCGTQVSLAARAKITQGAIGKYIRGETLPTGVTAKKLSKAVDETMPKEKFAPHIFNNETV